MILIYRKPKASVGSEWHFNTQCPHWPASSFVQVRYLAPEANERLCQNCVRLEATMFPQKEKDHI